ncbi:MAG TPA: L,D-transpeptidase family protein [Pseudolabrys sp.]|nr:L,D-transpeptidase family protein [Pseudolabrys sp.]
MRKNKFDLLLAGTVLALIAAPTHAIAAPDRIEAVVPLPPSLNDQMPRHREAAPVPPPEPTPIAATPQNTDTGIKSTLDRAIDHTLDRVLGFGDAQIGDKLRGIVAGKQMERRIDRVPERKAVESFYAARNYAPIWINEGHLNARAKSVIGQLKNAASDGLDPADYPVPDFGAAASAEAAADDDIKLTNSMLTYARHLAAGRIAPTRVLVEVDYGNHTPEPADILRKVAGGGDAGAALESYNPPHDGFRALKAKLAELRSSEPRAEADTRIADGRAIKPGDKDARVPELRQRLHVRGRAGDLAYDKALFDAIKHVQASANIKPTGVVDGRTLAAINGPKPLSPAQQIERVTANMERWRWLPRDLGKTYVMVNIPDYTLKVVHDHQVTWRTKIVAGKPQTPTPLLSASMDTVLVNPSWFVPQSIIQNELLPLYANDPNIFDRMGLEVKKGLDGNINVVQPPGAANALGRIKFNFPNKFQVYLHDTPEKRLFAADRRAFSHGCMRVEDPTKFGEIMLHLAMNGQTPNSQQLLGMFGKEEKTFKLMNKPTVHLTYQTAFVDDGKLVLRDDIYGFDARINSIMHSDERRIADVAPPQDPKRDAATAKSNQEILRRVERREAQNPLVFFERLFR